MKGLHIPAALQLSQYVKLHSAFNKFVKRPIFYIETWLKILRELF